MPASENNQPLCEHDWLSLSEESGTGPTLDYKVGHSICRTCATVKVAGFRGSNHFEEYLQIDLPEAVGILLRNIADVNNPARLMTQWRLKAERFDYIIKLMENFFLLNPTFRSFEVFKDSYKQLMDYDQSKYQ